MREPSASDALVERRGVTPRDVAAVLTIALGLSLLLAGLRTTGAESRTWPPLVVDPNTAPAGVLAALPTIGPARLAAWENARRERPFASVDELDKRVRGIGPARLAALRPYLEIRPDDGP